MRYPRGRRIFHRLESSPPLLSRSFHLAFSSAILLSLSSPRGPLPLFLSPSSSTSLPLCCSFLRSIPPVDRSLKGACLATFNNERTQNYLSTRRERMVLSRVFSDCVWPARSSPRECVYPCETVARSFFPRISNGFTTADNLTGGSSRRRVATFPRGECAPVVSLYLERQ